MNWTVHRVTKLTQRAFDEADGVCEHLKVGDTAFMSGEQDSFGPVTRFYECQACREGSKEAELNEEYCCTDCKQPFRLRNGILWKPYDFDPSDGSEPVPVCNGCVERERHQARVTRDEADYDREFGD